MKYVQKDKLLHFAASAIIAFCVGSLIAILGTSPIQMAFAAMSSSLCAGLAKEYADQVHYNGFDKIDIIADVIGACFGTGIIWLILLMI